MGRKKLTRRKFIGTAATGLTSVALPAGVLSAGISSCSRGSNKAAGGKYSAEAIAAEVERVLPQEAAYDYHKKLSTSSVHIPVRDLNTRQTDGEMTIPDKGWKLIWIKGSSEILQNAVNDFSDYLRISQKINVEPDGRDSLADWNNITDGIVAGTREQLPGCGLTLKNPKDYEITISPGRIVVCGFDERGVMFGLYNLEARMNLREAPVLPSGLNTVRHSLYDTRMVLSWMGWMEWPDTVLSHLAHDGYDGIFASVYANPNGDRTTAEGSTEFYARLLFQVRRQEPARIHDLIKRAGKYGIKVYTPIIYQYLGTPESEAGLRRLVKEILKEFPGIKGYILLTEGFYYGEWRAGHSSDDNYMKNWARNWCKAVGIVEEECHKVNPSIEILPWEYNIDFRPHKADLKRYFIRQLPDNVIPLLTWENGKSFEIDGMQGYLRDYSLSQIGPAEVTDSQIEEARNRKMKVYCKADTFASWQYGTIPYLPVPNQWNERYKALEKYGVNGTLESWSSGYKPNFISELRAWTCWSDCPPVDRLYESMASRIFGAEAVEKVVRAWEFFSQAIQLVPDTGPNMGTNNAVGNPLFFTVPPLRTNTYHYSWTDFVKWMGYFGSGLNPYWPFTVSRMVFYPDFTNHTNKAESYARGATGIQAGKDVQILPVFLRYLKTAAGKMEEGLKLYREAALESPGSKRQQALREVIVAEQLHRMMLSDCAILEFEDLRLRQVAEKDAAKKAKILDSMESILREEISRTELSLIAARHDSRLGFQFEQDYVYTPYSLQEKLDLLRETLEKHLPEARSSKT
jgi:hypothetical protein